MDVVDVFLWFANESFLAAEKADGQKQREIFLQLGSLWADAANQAAVPNANVAGVGAPERAVVVLASGQRFTAGLIGRER